MGARVGMYGDLQGIAGKSLQEIAGLELKALGQTSFWGLAFSVGVRLGHETALLGMKLQD